MISIVVPVRNGMPFIEESLNSIRQQDLRVPCEIIVVDDGSSDGTREFVRGLPLTCIELEGNGQGPAAARNAGIQRSRFDIVAFLDADDLWPPGALSTMANTLATHPEAGIARGTVRNFRTRDDGQREFFTVPYRCLNFGACLWRREVFDIVGLLDEDLRIGEDYDFLLRCWEHDIRKVEVESVVLHYRRHPGSVTHNLKSPGFGSLPVFKKRMDRARAGIFDASRPRHMTQDEYLALDGGPPDPDKPFFGR